MCFPDDACDCFMVRGDGVVFEVFDDHTRQRDDVEFLQFTGLHDTDGKEIYEGDVVNVVMPAALIGSQTVEYWRVVEWEDGMWVLESVETLNQLHRYRERLTTFRVIGNIYEHPHLLEPERAA